MTQLLWKTAWQFLKRISTSQKFLISVYSQDSKDKDSNTYSYTHVHGSSIHNSQRMEATQVSIDRWMSKQNLVFLTVKERQLQYMLQHERNLITQSEKSQKDKHCIIPIVWGTYGSQILKDQSRKVVARARDEGNGELFSGCRVPILQDEKRYRAWLPIWIYLGQLNYIFLNG